MFKSTRTSLADSFGTAQHMSFFDIPGRYSAAPRLSSDGTVLYFTSGLIGGPGDIYVSYWLDVDLTHLEIVGPNEVAENLQTQYKAIAYFDNDSSRDVTDLVEWSVEPNDIASITAGLLTTEMVDLPEDVTITAQYGEGDVNESAEKQVSIFAICPSGSALEFDGTDDYVDCGNDENLNITGDITISAWIYLTRGGDGSDASGQVIAAKTITRGAYNNPFDFRTSTGLVPRLTLVRADSSGHEYLYSAEHLSLNCWHYVAVTVNNNDGNFYVDGLITDKSGNGFTKPASGNSKPVYIGRRDDGLYFDGSIDEVAIFNRALSAEEIQMLMHIRPDYSEPNLVLYLDFDEGEGQVAYDSSLCGNDGTLGSTSGVDDNDPEWIESGAPVGICTLDGLVERNLTDILDRKLNILDELAIVLGKEDALLDYMDDAFHNGELDNLNKGDVVKAKQKIHSAIQQEEQAETAVDQSIDKLDDALNTLGIE